MSYRIPDNPIKKAEACHSTLRQKNRNDLMKKRRIIPDGPFDRAQIDSSNNQSHFVLDVKFKLESRCTDVVTQALIALKQFVRQTDGYCFEELAKNKVVPILVNIVSCDNVIQLSLSLTILAQIASSSSQVVMDEIWESGAFELFVNILESTFSISKSNLFQAAAIGFGNSVLSGGKFLDFVVRNNVFKMFSINFVKVVECMDQSVPEAFVFAVSRMATNNGLRQDEFECAIHFVLSCRNLTNFEDVIFLLNYFSSDSSLDESVKAIAIKYIWGFEETASVCRNVLGKNFCSCQSNEINFLIQSIRLSPDVSPQIEGLIKFVVNTLGTSQSDVFESKCILLSCLSENPMTSGEVLKCIMKQNECCSFLIKKMKDENFETAKSAGLFVSKCVSVYFENQQIIVRFEENGVVDGIVSLLQRSGLRNDYTSLTFILTTLFTLFFYQSNVSISEEYLFEPINQFEELGGYQILQELSTITNPQIKELINSLGMSLSKQNNDDL
ncbi:hypothetical protein EIN_226760 [Entamoeba invadens IP1]|uniref:Uncharacterized protein n=1 Tax=Entamoeba invadens IP1 TaxID=370355 RepID=A0A0A1U8I3_ENTIV|nr:hypothetical protein EIN_226760 [Entamoeba invadens IP1]ELP88293.1 hypothetical protein EIN_226760 [Entamoeba invadens IP1]|eukprot:XP_004255064.1 hypothetical protein EIN_226760 [Entamoeba invadens IP1]